MTTLIPVSRAMTGARRGRGRSAAPGARRAGTRTYVLLGLIAAVSAFPLYWSLVAASNDNSAAGSWPPRLLPGSHLWENLQRAYTQANFGLALANSMIVATVVTVSVVLTSTLAGFAFAKLKFRGRNALLGFLLVTMMVPAQLGIIPLYIMMSQWLGWTGHLQAVIVPAATSAFGVFLMRQYLSEALPDALLEAGRMDGCSTHRLYWHVVLPAARPVAAVLALFTFMNAWNDFFWPLLALGQGNPTTQVALSTLAGGYYMDYSLVLAGTLISTAPVLLVFLFLGKQIIGGIMQGAVKA
nr:carbohydrate ABC transporter permease [Dactylosporangium sucinum]